MARLAFRLPEPALKALAGKTARSDDGTPIDPALSALLAFSHRAGLPRLHHLPVPAARELMDADSALVAPRSERMASVEDRFIPGPAGPLRIRVYRPDDHPSRPLLVFFHGGGFVVGSLASHDPACRRIAAKAKCVVVAVDYRLAPEHPYPAAVEDAEAAFSWIATRAAELGADESRIGIIGDSAGGNLSAVVSRRLRDRGGPVPNAQFLIYPATDLTSSFPSHQRYGMGYFLDQPMIDWFMEHYFEDQQRALEPDASPHFAQDLAGLPPAMIVTAGFDPLRDEAEAYAGALQNAAVEVRFRCEEALIHGFISMGGISAACGDAVDRIAADIAEML